MFRRLFFILLLIFNTDLYATTYYVSKIGNDTCSGYSVKNSFLTVGKAAEVAFPGDTVFVMAGFYQEKVVPRRSGTPGAPILFAAYGNEEVIITSTPKDFCFDLSKKQWIILDGFYFRNAYGWILLESAYHNIVKNCKFDGSGNYHCIRIENGSYNTISHCIFLRAKDGLLDVDLADYIGMWQNCHFNLIEFCEFHRITHDAIDIQQFRSPYTPSHNIIRQCKFIDIGHRGVESVATNHTMVERNRFTGMAGEMIRMSGRRMVVRDNILSRNFPEPTGCVPDWDCMILMRSHQNEYKNMCYTQHSRIYNNVLYDCRNDYAIVLSPYLLMIDNIFKNNIFHNNNNLLYMIPPRETKNNDYLFENNIIHARATGAKMIRHSDTQYTLTEANEKLSNYYRDNREADPKFVNELAGDFRLSSSSSARDTGVPLTFAEKAGTGNQIKVQDAIYFSDGYGLTGGDEIVVGSNSFAVITNIDYVNNIMVLDHGITWEDKAPVFRPYMGKAPDMGVFEHGADTLGITTARLVDGKEGYYYFTHLEASGGDSPYAWAITSGNLPKGITLKNDGELSGVPADTGGQKIVARATDSAGKIAEREVTINITPAEFFSTIIEAELGNTGRDFIIVDDAASASGGKYVTPAQKPGDTPQDNMISYSFSVPSPALYYLWVEMYAPDTKHSRLHAYVNADSCRLLQPEIFGQYVWVPAGSEPFALNYGENHLILGKADELVRIDRIFITQDKRLQPGDYPHL